MADLTAALRALGRESGLALEEVAQCVPALEAERDPVAESLPTLLLNPVPLRGQVIRVTPASSAAVGRMLIPMGVIENASVPSLRAGKGTYIGLFLVTLSTLMFEIALTRIFSATAWYHFAFVAISLALFGLAAGALIVHLRPATFTAELVRKRQWQWSLLFGLSVVVCFVAHLSIPFVPEATAAGGLSVFLTCAIVSIPFLCSGVVVCLALTRFPRQVNRLYSADLLGAASGCVLLVVLFRFLDGPSLVVAVGSMGACGATFFARETGSRWALVYTAAAAVVLGGMSLANAVAHGQGKPFLRVTWAKGTPDPLHQYETWNAFSRVTVDPFADGPGQPKEVGFSTKLPADVRVEQLSMVIDSSAATNLTRFTGDPGETDYLRYDITNLVHWIRRDADVVVIGAGGGRDVLSALEFDQKSVKAVEINGSIIDAVNGRYGGFTGHLDRDPRVSFVNDEARSYLARTDSRMDVIQISLVDTWAATAAGAFALTENSLYTTEAWDLFLDRLEPSGILSVSRWYAAPSGETSYETHRLVALAARVLSDRGVERPRDHILMFRGPHRQGAYSTLLVSPAPFSAKDRAALAHETRRLGFVPVLTDTVAGDDRLAALAAPGGPGPAVASFPVEIAPPTDDRPFFFQMAELSSLLGEGWTSGNVTEQPVVVLGMLALTVLILAALLIGVPLAVRGESERREGMLPFYVYFAGIGLGFLFVEVAQLQRLSVFLGHPVYALAVVLFSLLVFSGIGSMASQRFADPGRGLWRVGTLLGVVAVVIACGVLTPHAIHAMDAATTPARIATAVALLAPLGLALGVPFATGMRAAGTLPAAPTSFLWGINGAASVCASVFAVVISLFFGITAAYWTGASAYVVAAAALAAITLGLRASAERVDESQVRAT